MNALLPDVASVDEHLAGWGAMSPLRPFDDAPVAFLADLAKQVLLDRGFRAFPELIAVAHALRPAEIQRRRDAFDARFVGRHRLARGTALHIAPANVDAIFLHSWALSMLCGNANIVRLSTRRGDQVQRLLDAIGAALVQHPEVARRTLIASWDREDVATTEAMSARCQVRVVWGGDDTVRRIRAVPLPPLATEVVFPDRFSLAALWAPAVVAASDADVAELARRFANDALWFNQQACSSPRLVAWAGPHDARRQARERFWAAFAPHAAERVADPGAAMSRFNAAAWWAATGRGARVEGTGADIPVRVAVGGVDDAARTAHVGFGLFLELDVDRLEDLATTLTARDQTLAVWGFGEDPVRTLVDRLPTRAIDRIVPVGSALEFSPIWDGLDLFAAFTRDVVVTP